MHVNFKANFIDDVPLKYYGQGSFVEIQPRNLYDLLAVREVADSWNTNLTNGILEDVEKCFHKNDAHTRFYAVTRQTKDFEQIKPAGILAMMETQNLSPTQTKINLLQVNPLNKREGIGRSIINCFKDFTLCKEILVHPLEDAMTFYTKMGFKPKNGLLNWILKK